MVVTRFENLAEFAAAAGTSLGVSEWFEVDQARIDAFADATIDHQWIHTDPERAAAGPYGTTVAHGYLTLSLVPHLTRDAYDIDNLALGVNYGLDRVRFPAPVPAGSRIRAKVDLDEVVGDGKALTAYLDITIEREGGDKPVCLARTIAKFVAQE